MLSKSLHLRHLSVYLKSDRKRPIDILQMSKHLKIRLPEVNIASNRLVLSG